MELEHVMSDLKDIESAARGYIITGKADFLEPNNYALKHIQYDIADLKVQMADYTLREIKLEELKRLVNEKIKMQMDFIQKRREKGFSDAQEEVTKELGKKKMDEIRLQVNEMMEIESHLLKKRIFQRELSTRHMFITGGMLIALFITAIFFVLLIIKRELHAREKVQRLLKQASEFTQMIFDTVPMPLVILDTNFNIISAIRSFDNKYNYNKESAENTPVFNLFDCGLDIKSLKEKLETIIPGDTHFDNYEVVLSDGRSLMLNARKIFRLGNHTMMILLGIDDVTEQKEVHDKVVLYTRELERKNITIKINADKPVIVMADRYSLETVIRNLVSNAFKFTPAQGHITISAEQAGQKGSHFCCRHRRWNGQGKRREAFQPGAEFHTPEPRTKKVPASDFFYAGI